VCYLVSYSDFGCGFDMFRRPRYAPVLDLGTTSPLRVLAAAYRSVDDATDDRPALRKILISVLENGLVNEARTNVQRHFQTLFTPEVAADKIIGRRRGSMCDTGHSP
jgi:hypothetical protein